jgi:tetratricopeptide (TPR) repeat protein
LAGLPDPLDAPSDERPRDGAEAEAFSRELSALLGDLVRAPRPAAGAFGWDARLRPGGRVGRFALERELGRGGFGIVFEARDAELDRAVALKVVRPGTRAAERGSDWIAREARAVAKLNHANIVTVHELGRDGDTAFLVMELLHGRTLSERLAEGPLPLEETLGVGLDVARALFHAHVQGVVHRDLKPSNVFLAGDGGAKVLDFGLAHLLGGGAAAEGGTPAYMAPEQWEGEGDHRTDLFSLGVVLFQCATGRLPYEARRGWSAAQEPGPTPALPRRAGPPAFRRLVRALLARDPADRPASVREVRDALLAVARAHRGRARRRWFAGVAGVAGVAVAVAAFLFLTREPPAGERLHAVLAAVEDRGAPDAAAVLPGLLDAALAPSRRVRLVSPARLATVARAAGLPPGGPLDAERARGLARLAGAEVVLLPEVSASGRGIALTVHAVEAETGRALFTEEARAAGTDGLAAAVDALASGIRAALSERREDRRVRRPVAESVTASAEAARHYYEGVDCLERRRAGPGASEACVPAFQKALAADPSFPLANYQLARLYALHGDSGARGRPFLEAALAGADRIPTRDAHLVRALAARLRRDLPEAVRLYDAALAETPDDAHALLAAADLQIQENDWVHALRYLEKLEVVAPDQEEPLANLVEAYGRLNRREELLALVSRLDRRTDFPGRFRAIVNARLWLGDPESALGTARRAAAELGEAEHDTLFTALMASGEFAEAERLMRRSSSSLIARIRLVRALSGQGRVRECLAELAKLWTLDRTNNLTPALVASMRASLRWPTGDVTAMRADAANASYAEPAILLGVMGDVAGARRAMPRKLTDPMALGQLEAVSLAADGELGTALARAVHLETLDPWPITTLAPSWLAAELAARTGNSEESLAAVERFRRLPPRGPAWAHAYVRTLYLEALAHHRLGQPEKARERLERLLSIWRRADPGLPLLGEARALLRSL